MIKERRRRHNKRSNKVPTTDDLELMVLKDTRSRKMSLSSQNSFDGDHNEPNTCETTKSSPLKDLLKNKKTQLPSYTYSGIVRDIETGIRKYYRPVAVDEAYETDTFHASVTQTNSVGRGLRYEVEAKQKAGMLLGDVVEPVAVITNLQQHSTLPLPNIFTNVLNTQDVITGTGNDLIDVSNESQPTSVLATNADIARMITVSSDEKRRQVCGFSGETDAQQIAGMRQSEEEAVKRMASSSHTPNPRELFSSSMSNIPTDPLSSPEEINGLENRLTNATILNPPTLALTSSVDVNSITSVSLDEEKRGKENSMVASKGNKESIEAVGIVNYEGGAVDAEEVQLNCPYGAISKTDGPVTIKITLEKPSTHCDMLVKNGLENIVKFIAPVINLQPNGQSFKKPVVVTTKLTINEDVSSSDVLVLHGTQARDGKIVWEDITHESKIDLEKKVLKVKIDGFSRIAALLRLTSIFTKDIITRLNLTGFNYTLSVLFKDSQPHSPFGELALVFMSRDVYHEKCYREHPSSAFMQLKGIGFEELCVIDRLESKRIYNNETLKVSVSLEKDYILSDGKPECVDFTVDSSMWWSTGHAIQRPLKGADGVRILCGKIVVEGQHGHFLENTFCELDSFEYVRRLLRVKGSTLNLVPVAQKLGLPEEAIRQATRFWQNDEYQLNIILQHWSKRQDDHDMEDPARLRNTLQGLTPGDCEVDERGKMHINHLRELAFEIQGLNHEDPHLMEYFTNQIRTLCDSILKDCCIEMDAEVSVTNYPQYLSFHRRVTQDVALKLEKICSLSSRSINEDFLSTVPFLIQIIKETFRMEKPLIIQNGLKGLPKETVDQHESKVLDAFKNKDILSLVSEVCEILANLCLHNCGKKSTEEIECWNESLGIWFLLEFLQHFFQSRQEKKLYKRLQLLSRSLKRISSHIRDFKEIEMRYFYNVALNLIKFATFDPSKLVRFEMTYEANCPMSYSEAIKYDRPHDTFSQQFEFRKESEDELQLGVIAHVHLDGRIRKVGAFESVIMLPPTSEEELATCPIAALPVTVKKERTDSGSLRVVLSSTRRKNITNALSLLQRDMGNDILGEGQAEITESPLTVRCFVEVVGVVRLRLLYKWGSEAISVDSKDFVAIDESSAADAHMSASAVTDASCPFEAELAALSSASLPCDKNGNFVMDPSAMELIQRHARQQCGRLELHLHQTFQKGHVCVTGENTSLHMEMPNTAQSFLQEGLCAPSQKSITAGPSSNEAVVSEQEKNKSSDMEEIEL
ncbi:hypothetical protein ACROYT_G022977 [Oculina patagonica]